MVGDVQCQSRILEVGVELFRLERAKVAVLSK
jgi:hypothetical protein